MFTNTFYVLAVLLSAVIIFLAIRDIMIWYWKINDFLRALNRIADELARESKEIVPLFYNHGDLKTRSETETLLRGVRHEASAIRTDGPQAGLDRLWSEEVLIRERWRRGQQERRVGRGKY